jgi:hypothetical protein
MAVGWVSWGRAVGDFEEIDGFAGLLMELSLTGDDNRGETPIRREDIP